MHELQRRNPLTHEAYRLAKYVYWFGALAGPRTWLRFKLARRPLSVRVRGQPAALIVRPHTSDVWTFEKIFISREYDIPLLRESPRTILDVGANVGYASAYFAARYPEARIIAIEPEPKNCELLRRNTSAFPNVTVVQAALWPVTGDVSIANPDAEPWAFRISQPGEGSGAAVRAITIPQILEEQGIDRVDVLKLDIEGAEKEVFQSGAELWLGRINVLIVELHDWLREGCGQAFYRATSQHPFKHFTAGENVILVRSTPGTNGSGSSQAGASQQSSAAMSRGSTSS